MRISCRWRSPVAFAQSDVTIEFANRACARGFVRGDGMSFKRTLVLTVLLALAAPTAARADGLLVPFIGVNFGGNSGKELSNAIDANRLDWGISLAYMGAGVLGVEADIAHSPDFYGKTDIGGSSVLTATGNLVIGIPIGGQKGVGFRPYGVAGLGVIRSRVDAFGDNVRRDNTEAAWDFGGGAMFFFANHVGVRGEVRYFRTFSDVAFDILGVTPIRETLDFTRASIGFIVRF
jgi:opacity protein-like surface antigen